MTALLAIYLTVGLVLAVCWTAAEFRLGQRAAAMLSLVVVLLLWPLLAAVAAALALFAGRFDPDRGRLRRAARRAMKRPFAKPQPAAESGEPEPRPSRASVL